MGYQHKAKAKHQVGPLGSNSQHLQVGPIGKTLEKSFVNGCFSSRQSAKVTTSPRLKKVLKTLAFLLLENFILRKSEREGKKNVLNKNASRLHILGNV